MKCFLKSTTALLLVTSFKLCQASRKLSTDFDVSHVRKETTPTQARRSVPQKAPMNERDLQGFAYRANYTAQFQYLRDVNCVGPAAAIQVSCYGPNIQLLNTSDPSIVCSTPFLDDFDWTTIECNNTCATDAACQSVYVNVGGNFGDGPFGEIFFLCEGNYMYDIDGAVSVVDSGNGTCAATSSQSVTRNIHIARMGVSCPSLSGNREYVFDDYFFECSGGFSYPGDGNPGDLYTCLDGQNCEGIACVVDFSQIFINADVAKFQDTCVEPVVPLAPTLAPVLNTTGAFTFSARFEAAWGLLFDPVSGSACSGDTPTVRMTCRNGDIKFVNSTYDTVKCVTVSPGVMDCTDNSTNFVGQFTGVVYVSGVIGLSCPSLAKPPTSNASLFVFVPRIAPVRYYQKR
jgi:hypothetical protein